MSPEEPSKVPEQPNSSATEPGVVPAQPTPTAFNPPSPSEQLVQPDNASVLLQPEPTNAEVSPASFGQPEPTQPVKTRHPVIMAVVILLVVALGGAAWWWQDQQNTPDTVFTAALTKLLSTKTITQSSSNDSLSETLAYDGTNLKAPKASINISLKSSGLTNKMSGYGTLQNSYLKYTSFGSSAIDSKVPTLVNKWVQLRKDGTNLKDVDTESEGLVDPRSLAFGDLMIGNFPANDRQKLLDYISTSKIYSYNAKQVTTATVNGSKAYVYSLTENVPKLKELNRKVAALMGIPVADIQPALDQLGTASTTKVYVDINSKQIVKYTSTQDGETVTGSYTEYDTTSLPSEPKADMTWDEFMQKQVDALSGLQGNTGASAPTSDASLSQHV